MTSLEAVTQIGEVFKLEVAVGAVAGGDLFVIHAQRIAHLVKQPRHGIGADAYAKGEEFLGDFGRGAPLGLTSEPPGERGEEAQGVFEEAKMKELAEQLVKMAIWDYLGCIHTISI